MTRLTQERESEIRLDAFSTCQCNQVYECVACSRNRESGRKELLAEIDALRCENAKMQNFYDEHASEMRQISADLVQIIEQLRETEHHDAESEK